MEEKYATDSWTPAVSQQGQIGLYQQTMANRLCVTVSLHLVENNYKLVLIFWVGLRITNKVEVLICVKQAKDKDVSKSVSQWFYSPELT